MARKKGSSIPAAKVIDHLVKNAYDDKTPRKSGTRRTTETRMGATEDAIKSCNGLTLPELIERVHTRDSEEWRRWERWDAIASGRPFERPEAITKHERPPQGILNGLVSFVPLDGEQTKFASSKAAVSGLVGGNGSGKSCVLCARIADELMTGRRKGSLPVHGWVYRPQFPKNPFLDPIFARLWFGDEKFAPFIPKNPKDNKAPSWMQHAIRGNPRSLFALSNGSTVEFRTWGQGSEVAAGNMPDFICIDDMCPDSMIDEIKMRLIRKDFGWLAFAVTDNVANHIWVDALQEESDKGNPEIWVGKITSYDNPYLSKDRVKIFSTGMDEIDINTRLGGERLAKGAIVYSGWSSKNVRKRAELPTNGTDYVVIDPGVANPCGIIWARVMAPVERELIGWDGLPDGRKINVSDVWLIGESYIKNEPDISVHVAEIQRINKDLGAFPIKYKIDGFDNARNPGQSRSTVTTYFSVWKETFKNAGINPDSLELAPTQSDMYRMPRQIECNKLVNLDMREYPNLYALDTMENLFKELRRYSIKGLAYSMPRSGGRHDREETYVGANHLIFGMETIAVWKPPYVQEATAEAVCSTHEELLSKLAWKRISRGVPILPDGNLAAAWGNG